MENAIFWVLWSATVGICVWKLVQGILQPKLILEWPFLACAMWSYFYGYKAYAAKVSLDEYLTKGSEMLGQFIPLICLIGLLLGWSYAKKTTTTGRAKPVRYPLLIMWMIGSVCLIIGTWGNFSVVHAAVTGTLVYKDASAYWYLLFYVGYPGLAIALWSLMKMESGCVKLLLGTLLLGELFFFMLPQVFNARRGPLYSAIIVLLLIPPLTKRKIPNPFLFTGVLALAAAIMLLFVQARYTIYNGGTWGEAIPKLDLGGIVKEQGQMAEDNEYINNCGLISTIVHNGKYQYGTGDLELFVHWIPKAMWPNKPALGEGYYPSVDLFDDVAEYSGFLCPLFWFGISWMFGKVYARTRDADNTRWIFSYVGFMCASHWLISQSFAAAFVPGMCFQAVPFVSFTIFKQAAKLHPVVSPARRIRPRPLERKRPAI